MPLLLPWPLHEDACCCCMPAAAAPAAAALAAALAASVPLLGSDTCPCHACVQPGGAKEAHCMVEDLLPSSTLPGSSSALVGSAGGWYPDPMAMLRQQALLAG